MSLVAAVPLGVGAAVVYGTSIVVQHQTAQQHAEGGGPSAAGLLRLARNPLWLFAILGDGIGFVLQAAALSVGLVVVVQPLVVLMLPVALAVSFLMGGHRPRVGDYVGVFAILGGLAVFLALIGEPAGGHVPRSRYVGMAVILVLLAGVASSLLVTGRNRMVRGAMYGAVAGCYFGTLAVLVDAASSQFSRHGLHGLVAAPRGIVPVAGIVLLGTAGIVLTQMSFQLGALGATLPANLVADPLAGVLFGVLLLHEHIPLSVWHLTAYAVCVAAVVAGAIRLADPHAGPLEGDERREREPTLA